MVSSRQAAAYPLYFQPRRQGRVPGRLQELDLAPGLDLLSNAVRERAVWIGRTLD